MANEHINRVDIVRSGSTQTLIDITDTTAVAADVAQGKYFYLATGEKVAGTSSGGGTGGITQDANGYLVLSDQGGGGGGGDSWSWMGKNPTKVQEWTEYKTFKQLGFDEWTYSTSTATLRASENLSPTVECDCSTYDYIYVIKTNSVFDYGSWSNPTYAMENFASYLATAVYGTYNSLNGLKNKTPNTATSSGLTNSSFSYCIYNTIETYGTTGYGLYSNASPSLSVSGTGATRTFTFKKPAISTRGSADYFPETAFNNLDFDESYYDLVCELWRVDAGTSAKGAIIGESIDILNNGLGVE